MTRNASVLKRESGDLSRNHPNQRLRLADEGGALGEFNYSNLTQLVVGGRDNDGVSRGTLHTIQHVHARRQAAQGHFVVEKPLRALLGVQLAAVRQVMAG